MAIYTEDFKKKVKKLYGNSLDKYLDSGNEFLGRILDDSSMGSVSLDKILSAKSLEEIQKEAKLIKEKKEIYLQYWEQVKK